MKRFLPLIITLALGQALQAQKMRDVFAAMPDSVLGIMTKNNRLDCIDFIENDMEAKVRNRFDGFSVLKVDGGLSRLATDAELPGGDEAFAGRRYAELYLRGAYLFRAGNRDEGHPLRAGLERVAGREVDTLSRVCRFLGNERFGGQGGSVTPAAFAGHALCDGFPATGRYAADFCFAARRSGQGGGGAYEKGFTSCRI